MSWLRGLMVALTVVAVALSPLFTSTSSLTRHATQAFAAPSYVDDDNDHDNDDSDDDDNDDDSNDDDDNDSNDHDDDDDNNNDDDDDNNGDDDDDDNGDDDDDNGDDDDDGDDNDNDEGAPAPPSIVAPPAPSDTESACVTGGSVLTLQLPGGTAVVTVPPGYPSVEITLRAVDPNSVPGTPGARVDDIVFQVSAQNCGGGGLGSLPGEVNVSVKYSDAAAGGLTESALTLSYLDGGTWREAPKVANDPPNNYIGSSTNILAVYAAHQK